MKKEKYLFDEVKDFAECGLCGTAAVISPVGKIVDHGEEICLPSGMDEDGTCNLRSSTILLQVSRWVRLKLLRAGFTQLNNSRFIQI